MLQFSRSVDLRVRRPDRLRAEIVSDLGPMRLYFDGASFTLHHLGQNVFSTVEAKGTVAQMVQRVREGFDVQVPLADLVSGEAYERYRERADISAIYAGLHYYRGALHHHVLLSNDEIDYQIWIEDGATPLPRKIVVTYASQTGAPQLTARISTWDLRPHLPDQVFEFHPPADADEIEMLNAPGSQQ